MKGQILAFFVLCAALSIAFSSPLQQNALHVPTFENVNRCFQPLANGLCLAYFPSYYYSPGKKTCEQFIYGGCGGNENRFPTFTACMAACEGVEPEEKEFKLILPSETIDPCSQPSDSGPCRAGMPRFYFNGDICESFLYGGCQGNANNFISLEECQQRCGTKSSDESNEAVPTSETKSEETSEEQPQSEESEKNE